jgi:NADH dehydrogenase [ubiquinone] 1 alpha subcomplex assembly factor 6
MNLLAKNTRFYLIPRLVPNKNKNLINLQSRLKASNAQLSSNFKYCIDLVKTNEPNCYYATLLTPQPALRTAFALRALNIELFSIKRAYKETRIAEIKLQFWKDQLNAIFDKETKMKLNEPISSEIALVTRNHNLSKIWFTRLIEGRKHFLTTQQFKDFNELEKCAEASMSSVYYIIFNSLNVKNVDCDHAASHLGKAQMYCNIVKNLFPKKNSTKGQSTVYYLPADILIKNKIAQQDLINFSERILRPKQNNLKDLCFDLCTRAKQHLESARNLNSKIPSNARMVLVGAIECEVFLDKMQQHDFDLFNEKLNSEFRNKIILKLLAAKFRNKF